MKNEYLRIFLFLTLFHALTTSLLPWLAFFDYGVVLYIALIGRVNERTLAPYAVVYGLFHDFLYTGIIGFSVLLFLLFGLLKQKADLMIDMDKQTSRMGFYTFLVTIFVFTNMKMFGYPEDGFVMLLAIRVFIDVIILSLILFAVEMKRAFSYPA